MLIFSVWPAIVQIEHCFFESEISLRIEGLDSTPPTEIMVSTYPHPHPPPFTRVTAIIYVSCEEDWEIFE